MLMKTINYESFNDFLDDMKYDGRLYKLLNTDTLDNLNLFRGQADDWPLIPNVLREDYKINGTYILDYEKEITKLAQFPNSLLLNDYYYNKEHFSIYSEKRLLIEFYINANRIGLKLPHTPIANNNFFVKNGVPNELLPDKWLSDDYVDLAALAQHYGVPTRLLDWTLDINVALYFAAMGAIEFAHKNAKRFVDNKKIVLWLLNGFDVEVIKVSDKMDFEEKNRRTNHSVENICEFETIPLQFVTPNYNTNPNLCAQKGILTYWQIDKKDYDKPINRQPLNKLVESYSYIDSEFKNSIFTKITLPVTESLKIIKYLYANGYNKASIFPSFYGAAQKITEEVIIHELEKALEQ